jgi:hypothetical protein
MLSFLSCGYLDVSVPRVRFRRPMNSGGDDRGYSPLPGFPIRRPPDQRSFASFPELFAGCRVLRRLSMPRHPPYTLSRLTTFIDHRHSPAQNTRHRGVRQTTTRLAEKGARRHPPDGRHSKPAGGDHRQGSAGAGVADSSGDPPSLRAHGDHRTTYYLEPRHSLVKEPLPSASPALTRTDQAANFPPNAGESAVLVSADSFEFDRCGCVFLRGSRHRLMPVTLKGRGWRLER